MTIETPSHGRRSDVFDTEGDKKFIDTIYFALKTGLTVVTIYYIYNSSIFPFVMGFLTGTIATVLFGCYSLTSLSMEVWDHISDLFDRVRNNPILSRSNLSKFILDLLMFKLRDSPREDNADPCLDNMSIKVPGVNSFNPNSTGLTPTKEGCSRGSPHPVKDIKTAPLNTERKDKDIIETAFGMMFCTNFDGQRYLSTKEGEFIPCTLCEKNINYKEGISKLGTNRVHLSCLKESPYGEICYFCLDGTNVHPHPKCLENFLKAGLVCRLCNKDIKDIKNHQTSSRGESYHMTCTVDPLQKV